MAPPAAGGVLAALRALARCRQAISGAPSLASQHQQFTSWAPTVSRPLGWGMLPAAHGAQAHLPAAATLCRQGCSAELPSRQPVPGSSSSAGMVTRSSKHGPLSDRYRSRPTNYVQLLQHVHRARKLSKLQELLDNFGDKFDAVHVAAAITVLPKCLRPTTGPSPGVPLSENTQAAELLARLQSMAQQHKGRMFVRQIANIMWALGQCRKLPMPISSDAGAGGLLPLYHTPINRNRLRHRPVHALKAAASDLLEDLLDELAAKGYRGAGGRDVAQLLHGMARLKVQHWPALNRLARWTASHAHQFEAKDLALAAWGFSRLGYGGEVPVFEVIADAAAKQHVYLRPWSACALLGAFAHRGKAHEGLFAAACAAMEVQMRSFTPRDLGVMAWALGRVRYRDEAMMQRLAARACEVLEGFKPLELGLLLRGLHDAKVLHQPLMDAVAAGIAAEEAVALAPADAVRMLEAFAALDPQNPAARDMAERVSAAWAQRVHELSPSPGAAGLLALSRLGGKHDALLGVLGNHIAQMVARSPLPKYESGKQAQQPHFVNWCEQLVDVLIAYNRLGYEHPELFQAAAGRLQWLIADRAAEAPPQGKREDALQERHASQEGPNPVKMREKRRLVRLENAIDIASELATAGQLQPGVGAALAASLAPHLPLLRPRKLAMALRALSSRDGLLQQQPVQELFAAATVQLAAQQEGQQQGSPLVLSASALALARASQGGHVQVGGAVLGSLFSQAAARLDDFTEPQACELLAAVQMAGGAGQAEGLAPALDLMAQQRGWEGLEQRLAASTL